MKELNKLSIDELRLYKAHIIDEIYKLKKIKRQIDKIIRKRCKDELF